MLTRSSLTRAKLNKFDEFYTQLKDIENELKHYKHHFKNKTVYCNADDPRISNFFHYFSYNFEHLGLKKLIATCYKNQEIDLFSSHDKESAIALVYEGEKDNGKVPTIDNINKVHLNGDGDFRSREAIEFLKEADIVVTNPPFSLFREYVAQLIRYDKQFLILGNQNAITYKEIFPLLKENKVWLGHNNGVQEFIIPKDAIERSGQRVDVDGIRYQKFGNIAWFTNLDIAKRHEKIILFKPYSPDKYPAYDNYDAIEVSRVSDIPIDYHGIMGVPITFLDKHNPDQFEIVGITKTWFDMASKKYPRQIQVSRNGARSEVTKLNDGATLKLAEPPKNKTYYMVDEEIFIQLYARILIKLKGS
jgi:hypothetical protein